MSLLLILISSLLQNSFALMGPSLPVYEHPQQVCLIKYVARNNPQDITGICSGVLIKQNTLLTAGHCISEDSDLSLVSEVICPNGQSSKVLQQNRSPFYEDVWQAPDSARKHDLATMILETSISLAPLRIAKDKLEVLHLLQNSPLCGLFGYGGKTTDDFGVFYLQGGTVNKSAVYFEEGVIWVPSLTNQLTSMIVPGDSGGSFACQDSQKKWIHIGQNSGMSFNYESLIAPAYEAFSFVDITQQNSSKYTELEQKELREKINLRLQENSKRLLTLEKILNTSAPSTLAKLKIELNHLKQNLINQSPDIHKQIEDFEKKFNEARSQYFKPNKEYKVSQFSRIHLTDHFSVKAANKFYADEIPYDLERYSKYSQLNIGDNPANLFKIKKVHDSLAYGDLIVRSTTQHYACIHFIICRPQIVKNVVISIKDLVL